MYSGRKGDLKLAWPNRYASYLSARHSDAKVINLSKPGHVTYHAMPTGTKNRAGLPNPDITRNVTAALSYDADAIILALPHWPYSTVPVDWVDDGQQFEQFPHQRDLAYSVSEPDTQEVVEQDRSNRTCYPCDCSTVNEIGKLFNSPSRSGEVRTQLNSVLA